MIRARKRLGQHFLHDPAVIDRLISTIAPEPKDAMVEIGSGRGALTQPLLETLETIHVIELDARLAEYLMKLVTEPQRLIMHRGDALKIDFSSLVPASGSLRIVGNLPYNISTPILFHLLSHRTVIEDMHLMLQKEVATRITATPGGKEYGRLTVMLAPWVDAQACFDVGPGAFSPPPKVWSTVIRLTPRTEARFNIKNQERFSALVARTFSMRRKTIARSLSGWLSREQISAAGIDPGERPEQLRPEDFAKLANLESCDWTGDTKLP